jgi:hypothetical protein
VEVLSISLPDWAWLIICGGILSLLIVTVLGCTMGFRRLVLSRVVDPD